MSDVRDRVEGVRAGTVAPEPLLCDECGRPMRPGERVLCGDGYARIYGEFVLDPRDDLHEDNWPVTHAACGA